MKKISTTLGEFLDPMNNESNVMATMSNQSQDMKTRDSNGTIGNFLS
jgi:hypothetical protein